jgi:hypothetical protein
MVSCFIKNYADLGSCEKNLENEKINIKDVGLCETKEQCKRYFEDIVISFYRDSQNVNLENAWSILNKKPKHWG